MTDPVEGSIEPGEPEPVEEALRAVLSEGIRPTSDAKTGVVPLLTINGPSLTTRTHESRILGAGSGRHSGREA